MGLVALIVGGMALVGAALKPLGNWNLLLFFVVGVGAWCCWAADRLLVRTGDASATSR
jgi:hypothetical protein